MEFTWNLGALPYGVEWRQHRRAFHQYLNNNAVQKYHPIMNEETKMFLQRIKSNPDHVFIGLQL
jgi:cytochrome P450